MAAPRQKKGQPPEPGRKRSPTSNVPGETAGPARSFRATLEPDHTSLKWVIVRIPFDVAEAWTTMRRLRVRGEMDDIPFRTSLFPNRSGQPGHFLLVNKRMQSAAGVSVGTEAAFVIEPDLAERPAALPPELKQAFEGDRDLLRFTEQLSESTRREIVKWIDSVKAPDARARRVAQLAQRLLLAMEGEHTPPPILETIFARNPRARSAWQALTPTQRRSHLLGIFYYQTPEARTRRAEKAVDEALHLTGKSPSTSKARS